MESVSIVAIVAVIATLLINLGTIFGTLIKVTRWFERQKEQDVELAAIRNEQSLLTYCMLISLKHSIGEKNDEDVRKGINMIEKHLNQKAHNINDSAK